MEDPDWNKPILYNTDSRGRYRPVKFYRSGMGVSSAFLIKSSGSMI